MAYITERVVRKLITVIPGRRDSLVQSVFNRSLRILEAVGAPLEWEVREAGASVFKKKT